MAAFYTRGGLTVTVKRRSWRLAGRWTDRDSSSAGQSALLRSEKSGLAGGRAVSVRPSACKPPAPPLHRNRQTSPRIKGRHLKASCCSLGWRPFIRGYVLRLLCNVSHRRFYALNKFGLATAVNPAEPVITTPFAPPLQWTISRLPSASVPPAMPTWESSG